MYHEYVGAGDPSASQQNVTFPPSIRTASLGSRVINGVSEEGQHRQAKLIKSAYKLSKQNITKYLQTLLNRLHVYSKTLKYRI